MQINVVYYGRLKEVSGAKRQTLELDPGQTLGGLIQTLTEKHPALREQLDSLAYVVDDEIVELDYVLRDGDTAGLLPPVSGG